MRDASADDAQPVINWEEACTYEYFLKNRYLVPRFSYNGTQYEAICNNGFIKLYIPKMRAYWIVQNEFGHQLRDWKFHVSVAHEDVARAWNILARMFVESRCRGCMKVSYLKESQTPRGREITIYIFKFEEEYEESQLAIEYGLSLAEEHSEDFWVSMFYRIEAAMAENNIKPNGLADGDLGLGSYVSLRNQSYVKSELNSEYIYPPDQFGWNSNQQEVPIDIQKAKFPSKGFGIKRDALLAASFLLLLLLI